MNDSRIIYTPRGERKAAGKSRKKRILFWLIVFFTAAVLGGIIYFLRLPEWRVGDINVSGNKVLSREEILDEIKLRLGGSYAFLLPRSSIFLVSGKEMEDALREAFPRIRSVNVEREFPRALSVRLEEREFWRIFCIEADSRELQRGLSQKEEGNCVYIDNTGFAYEKAPESTGALIKKIRTDEGSIEIGARILEEELIRLMQFLEGRVKETIRSEVVEWRIIGGIPREIRAITDEGFMLYFNRADDFENVFRVLNRVLEDEIKEKRPEIEYVDLRFGNKVFYKLK